MQNRCATRAADRSGKQEVLFEVKEIIVRILYIYTTEIQGSDSYRERYIAFSLLALAVAFASIRGRMF